ncbi:MAG: tetratricopeptide repeat protein [Candidatus Parcubacteria bacterium]|nr:tetratricopeptide repeat protein [Candidatus Parcubacteria bacterium]
MNEESQEIIEGIVYEEVYIHEPNHGAEIGAGKTLLERSIVGILVSFIALMPFFFLPLNGVAFSYAKNVLLSFAVISTVILTFFLWIKKEVIVLPKSPVFGALTFLVIIYSLSSLFSGSFSASFFGTGAEITTSFELFLLSVLTLLIAIFFRAKKQMFFAFMAMAGSFVAVFLFQIFHFVFPKAVFLSITADKTANLVGGWNDLGIFSGIIAILALVALEKFPLRKNTRGMFYIFLVAGLFFHSLVFFGNSWIILAIISFALSVFVFFSATKEIPLGSASIAKKWLLSPSFIVAAVSVLFVFFGMNINAKLFDIIGLPPVQDVRPSWSGTLNISRSVITENIKDGFLGVGPNRFFIPWQQYRPVEVNYTPWWGVDFNEGVGSLSSTAVTSGILGFLGWVAFLLLFLVGGFRALRKRFAYMDPIVQYASLASFIGAVYSWSIICTNTVGVVPFIFAFVLTGLFLGTISASGLPQVNEYDYSQNPRVGFAFVVALLLLLGSGTALGYYTIQRARSFFLYRNAMIAGNAGDFKKANVELEKALSLSQNDTYYRSFALLSSYQAQQVLASKDLSADQIRTQFGTNFQNSITGANKAILMDSSNYMNWIVLGNMYFVLIPLNIKGVSGDAYIQAKASYEQAAKRNPYNPQIPYTMAQLALLNKQNDEAKTFLKKALDLKNDYSDALILMAQIEGSTGDSGKALDVMEKASAINFSDPMVLFQLGYLRYQTGNYESAATALEKAIQLTPDYSNAKYFLGLSYFKFGQKEDALKEFKDIQKLNPDNKEVAQIIKNLENGYAPLSSLGVKEDTKATTTAKTTKKK